MKKTNFENYFIWSFCYIANNEKEMTNMIDSYINIELKEKMHNINVMIKVDLYNPQYVDFKKDIFYNVKNNEITLKINKDKIPNNNLTVKYFWAKKIYKTIQAIVDSYYELKQNNTINGYNPKLEEIKDKLEKNISKEDFSYNDINNSNYNIDNIKIHHVKSFFSNFNIKVKDIEKVFDNKNPKKILYIKIYFENCNNKIFAIIDKSGLKFSPELYDCFNVKKISKIWQKVTSKNQVLDIA